MAKNFDSPGHALAEGKARLFTRASMNTTGSLAAPERHPDLPTSYNTALLLRVLCNAPTLLKAKPAVELTNDVALICRHLVIPRCFCNVLCNAPPFSRQRP
jgi:hypothetical protein